MKMLRFIAVAVVLVVGTSVSAQQSSGTVGGFIPANISINVWFSGKDGSSWKPVNSSGGVVVYDKTMGTISEVAQVVLDDMAQSFTPLTGIQDYHIAVSIESVQGGKDTGLAWQNIPTGGYSTFRLTPDGKIPTEMLQVKLGWFSYLTLYRPGLRGVELAVTNSAGQRILHEVTPNGVSDTGCSLYPGGGAYLGPDFLELYGWVAFPEIRIPELVASGTLTEFYANGFRVVDIVTGSTLSDTRVPPLTLAISVTRLTAGQLKGLGPDVARLAVNPRVPVKITVRGAPGTLAVLEYRDGFAGAWRELTALVINATGTVEALDDAALSPTGQRFYRARLGPPRVSKPSFPFTQSLLQE